MKVNKFNIAYMLIVFTISLILPFSGCWQQPAQITEPPVPKPEIPPITPKVITCLNQLHDESMQQIDADIADLDSRIAVVERKEQGLHELKTQLDDRVESLDMEVAQERLRTGGWWEFTMPQEDFELYEDEYYELVEFDLRWDARVEESIWKLKKDMAVSDRETGNTGTPQMFLEELSRYRSELVASKEAKLEQKEASDKLLSDVIGTKDAWEIEEISKGVYEIIGYGLGYTDQLSFGEWYYYEESKAIEPRFQAAISLRDAITGG